MDINLQRKIDRIVGSVICRVLSLLNFQKQSSMRKTRDINKVLVILLSEMGSLVLAYPLFLRLKKLHPNASINVLVFKKNREILELTKVVDPDNIITIDDSSLFYFAKSTFAALRQIRREKIDAAIDCELFARVSSILSFLSGARIRVGFHPHTQEGLYRGNFINRPVMYNPYYHISQQFITLAEAINSESVPSGKRLVSDRPLEVPDIKIEPAMIDEYKKQLLTHFPAINVKKLVLLYPSGGLLAIRAWPLEHYCKVAQQLIHRGYAVGIIGMKEDKGIAQHILDHCKSRNCIDLTGYTKSIWELMLLFNIASLLITNDGGPGQFSAMTPIKTIIFFGPETGSLYRSHNRNTVVFQTHLSCSPCVTAYNHRKSPCDGDNQCLKLISPERVIDKAFDILLPKIPTHLFEEIFAGKNKISQAIVEGESIEKTKSAMEMERPKVLNH
jgi:ADP-heptose:LPS heptosyltransferase